VCNGRLLLLGPGDRWGEVEFNLAMYGSRPRDDGEAVFVGLTETSNTRQPKLQSARVSCGGTRTDCQPRRADSVLSG
jgi:hypothetical protein